MDCHAPQCSIVYPRCLDFFLDIAKPISVRVQRGFFLRKNRLEISMLELF